MFIVTGEQDDILDGGPETDCMSCRYFQNVHNVDMNNIVIHINYFNFCCCN